MKIITIWFSILATATGAFAQGLVSLSNFGQLISVGGNPMPVSGDQEFIFAVFLAPSTTFPDSGSMTTFTDPAFGIAAAYFTNSTVAAGRINSRNQVDVTTDTGQGFTIGSTVDFIIRGWSANLGYSWPASMNNLLFGNFSGQPWWGWSTVGNNLVLGGLPLPTFNVFGNGLNQVQGFNLVTIPEPPALSIAGLVAVAMWLFRNRQKTPAIARY